jgi:single-strand DNA-binding protein
MKDLNKIILIGRLGADPVQRETKSGISLVQFSLATSRIKRKRSDGVAEDGETETAPEFAEETVWHRVIAWGRQGEVCAQRLKRGQSVFVEGSLRSRKYTDKDNIPRMAFEVHADSVGFLTSAASARQKNLPLETIAEV